jgi:uncharacterized cupin superfamily protein
MILRKGTVPVTEGVSGYPGPYNLGRGHIRWQAFSDAAGLTQFGANFEMLAPGARSSQTHWHETEDEFLYLIDGTLTVIEGETETQIHPGDACCWKAGNPVGHSLRNDSDQPATYIIVGTRNPADICHYPGIDLRAEPGGYVHLDGTPWEKPE